jgi:hypothetical protein
MDFRDLNEYTNEHSSLIRLSSYPMCVMFTYVVFTFVTGFPVKGQERIYSFFRRRPRFPKSFFGFTAAAASAF